jgi:hypothetical protein
MYLLFYMGVKHGLMFESRSLRSAFGTKRKEVTWEYITVGRLITCTQREIFLG